MSKSNPSAVLCTVPMMVIVAPVVMSNPENVFAFKVGFPERNVKWRFMNNSPCYHVWLLPIDRWQCGLAAVNPDGEASRFGLLRIGGQS